MTNSMKVVMIFQDALLARDIKIQVLEGMIIPLAGKLSTILKQAKSFKSILHDVCTVNNKLNAAAQNLVIVLNGCGIEHVKIHSLFKT